MIMPQLEAYFSTRAVYLFIIMAIVLALIFRLLHYLVPALPVKRAWKSRLLHHLPAAEVLLWLTFLIWGVGWFIRHNIYVAITLGIILVMTMIWFSWFTLRHLIAGIVMRWNRDLKTGEPIKTLDYQGKIQRMGYRSLVLETDQGQSIYLPWAKIINQEIIRSHPADKIQSHTFTMKVTAKKTVYQTTDSLKTHILSLPWVSLVKKPEIMLLDKSPDNYTFQITIYSIEKSYFVHIENALKENSPE